VRWLALYLRSRSAPAALAAALGSVAALWWLHQALDDPEPRPLLALLAAVAGTAAIAPGLAGADRDLDRTAAIAWPPRRAAHLAVGAAVVVGLLAATALTGDPLAPAGPIVRDVAGLGGLVALGAAILGAARAPLLPVAWTLLVLRFSPALGGTPPSRPGYKQALTWMIQPDGTTAATAAAVLLGVGGALAYAVLGPRR
jgi:hypothetical protein